MKIDVDSAVWDETPTTSTDWSVTIWPKGLLNFSSGATARFGLTKEGRRVKMGYIAAQKLLLFKIVDDENESGTIKVAARQKGAVVSARGSLDKFGVPYEGPSTRYPLIYDEEGNILAAQLDKGAIVTKTAKDKK